MADKRKLLTCSAVAAVLGLAAAAPASAQTSPDILRQLQRLQDTLTAQQQQLADQQRALEEQSRRLADQQALIETQAGEIEALRRQDDAVLTAITGRGAAPRDPDSPIPTAAAVAVLQAPAAPSAVAAPPATPVGEAPPEEPPAVEVAALPEGTGVLTPRGGFVFEPSFDFTRSSANRLVFRGIEIVTGLQIGVIEASDADRDALGAALTVRYGLTNRLEVEGRLAYLYRADHILTLAQRDESITREFDLRGDGVGDVEVSGRYQLNRGRNGAPIYIAGLRVKSDTGSSPFEIPRDEFGVLTELPTGSGFWAVEPGVSFLYPSDPVVIYGSIGYLFHLAKSIDQTIGDAFIGDVDPGDSISASFGFGFALNPRFSFSLGYKHNYIWPTETEFGQNPSSVQSSDALHVGALLLGMSFRLTQRMTLSGGFEFGVTSDAPGVRITLRIPIRR